MFIYFWVLLLSLFWAYLLAQVRALPAEPVLAGRKWKKNPLLYALLALSCLPLVLLSGLRYDVGVDYFYTYVPIYQKVAAGASLREVGVEPAYYLLNKLIVLLGGGTVWVFFLTSLITIGLFFLAFYQQSELFVLSVALYVAAESYFIGLMYVRQFLAAGIVVYAFRFIREKKFWKYALCVLAATLFHLSAILFLPLYLLCLIPLHPAVLIGGLTVLSALHDLLKQALETVISLTKYGAYLGTGFQQPYRFYTEGMLKYTVLFLAACLFYKKNKSDRFFIFCLNCMALLVYFAYNFDIMPQTDRISWYLELVVLFLIPMLVSRCSAAWAKPILLVGLLGVYGAITVSDVCVNKAHGVIPYRFVYAPSTVFW